MQINDQKNIVTREAVAELRLKLPNSYGKLISEMLGGQYHPGSISLMVRGHRKMKPVVFEAATKLINTIESLKTTQNENQTDPL
jgi:hypothetical protein